MAHNDWCLLRVPAGRAGVLLETLRDRGIEAQTELAPVRLEIKSADLERVLQMLEQTGIGYVIESKTSE